MVELTMMKKGRVEPKRWRSGALQNHDANTVTPKNLQREVGKMKKQMTMMRTGQVIDNHTIPMTAEEQRVHQRTGHAKYDPRCAICVQTRGIARHPRQSEAETVNFDFAAITSVECPAVNHTLIVAGGPRGETFARRVPRKGAKMTDVTRFLEVMKARYEAGSQ